MRVGNESLDILSRNIANSGTPGYHRQSLSVIDRLANSPSARTGGLERVFNKSLQSYYTRAGRRHGLCQRPLQPARPAAGLDRQAGRRDLARYAARASLRNALSTLATSPDDPASRASMLSKAQAMAATLNRLTPRRAEPPPGDRDADRHRRQQPQPDAVDARADQRAAQGHSGDGASRASLLDQRDRLVSQVSELIGVRADYRDNGTVALTTLSGVGLLDGKAGRFEFTPAGQITANSIYDQRCRARTRSAR